MGRGRIKPNTVATEAMNLNLKKLQRWPWYDPELFQSRCCLTNTSRKNSCWSILSSMKRFMLLLLKLRCSRKSHCVEDIPYILEYNAHTFYSFRGPKSRMRIRFAVKSWIFEKWYSRCTCRKNNTIQSFIILFITVGAWGGRSVSATANEPRKCLGTTPVYNYG
jgi:hypothetical protein